MDTGQFKLLKSILTQSNNDESRQIILKSEQNVIGKNYANYDSHQVNPTQENKSKILRIEVRYAIVLKILHFNVQKIPSSSKGIDLYGVKLPGIGCCQ